jgi:hypothetical protein
MLHAKPTWLITDEHAVIIYRGEEPRVIKAGTDLHKQVMQALLIDGDYDKVHTLLTPEKHLEVETQGDLKITPTGTLRDKQNDAVDPIVRDYLEEFLEKGLSLEPLVKLAANIKKVADPFVRDQMVRFLRCSKFPITDDGCFIAFKRVKEVEGKLLDIYTGKIPNNVGDSPRMAWEDVTKDPHTTCSAGLHVGAWGYMGVMSGDVTLAVKVNPADVVSVPYDYQDQKMRTMGYTVVASHLKSPDDYKPEILHKERPSRPKAVKAEVPAAPVTGEITVDLDTLSGSQIIKLTWLQCKKRITISQKSKVRVLKYAVEHFQSKSLHVSGHLVKAQSRILAKAMDR